jgi:hypothetical protein
MPGPDFSHGGEFVEFPDEAPLDERFPAWVDLARENLGRNVELARWPHDPNDERIRATERWWQAQIGAIKRHVGPLDGLKLTVGARQHKTLGKKIARVRFNRTRPVIVRDRATG